MSAHIDSLEHLVSVVRGAPGLRAKRELSILSRLGLRAGDDGAVIPFGDVFLIMCAEAIAPELARDHPYAAGVAAVATNVADVRAMGGRPIAIVDTVVSPDRQHAEGVLDGIAWAAELFGVPVVGGHLTVGAPAAVSAACTGSARVPLHASAARPGDALLVAMCTEGAYLGATPFFSSLRVRDPDLLRTDGDVLATLAESGQIHACRDVSMPGVAGSLLQLLELAGCGARLAVDHLPRPVAVPLERWLVTFPSFGFVMAAPPDRVPEVISAFATQSLDCAQCGEFTSGRSLHLSDGPARGEVWDLAREPLTAPEIP
jgi:selenophosphate synthetase-related protein